MNAKNITKALRAKMQDWIDSVDDADIKKIIRENAIVTGGALVSLLNNEAPNDYDVYFKTFEACRAVAEYYAAFWNKWHPEKSKVEIKADPETKRITAFVRSVGAVEESGDDIKPDISETQEEPQQDKPEYRPRYFSTNAISLSDKIQIVIRFHGSVDEIHKNYDFIHCTCSYDLSENKVNLPAHALEAIINKELFYTGSKYPLCSIIRSRKFIERGWRINAGQYLKMCLQLNELDLKNLDVFADQLTGVDSAYFEAAIAIIKAKQEKEPNFRVDNSYLFEVINRIF
jgi:hypothetical protein